MGTPSHILCCSSLSLPTHPSNPATKRDPVTLVSDDTLEANPVFELSADSGLSYYESYLGDINLCLETNNVVLSDGLAVTIFFAFEPDTLTFVSA